MCDYARHSSFLRISLQKDRSCGTFLSILCKSQVDPGFYNFPVRCNLSKCSRRSILNQRSFMVLLLLYITVSNLLTCQPNTVWAALPISLVKFWNMGTLQICRLCPSLFFLFDGWTKGMTFTWESSLQTSLHEFGRIILKDVLKTWANYKNGDVHQRVLFVGKRGNSGRRNSINDTERWPFILSRGWEKSTSFGVAWVSYPEKRHMPCQTCLESPRVTENFRLLRMFL